MGFTKVRFVHNNKIWNSLLHITQRTSSQGKELHVVKHAAPAKKWVYLIHHEISVAQCSPVDWFLNERSRSLQAFWLSFVRCLRPQLWIYCAAAIAMGFLGDFVQAPQVAHWWRTLEVFLTFWIPVSATLIFSPFIKQLHLPYQCQKVRE
jgi:hypothetical protein